MIKENFVAENSLFSLTIEELISLYIPSIVYLRIILLRFSPSWIIVDVTCCWRPLFLFVDCSELSVILRVLDQLVVEELSGHAIMSFAEAVHKATVVTDRGFD
jgi:hypothetical protein